MIIRKLELENYTVFSEAKIEFSKGINILIGENGTGKTHVMKVLYSAAQSVDSKTSFPHKLARTMLPDDYKLSQLVSKGRKSENTKAAVFAQTSKELFEKVLIKFNTDTKGFDAKVHNEHEWKKTFAGSNSVYIPAKEILSNCYNLVSAVERDNVRFDDTYTDLLHMASVDVSDDSNTKELDLMLDKIEKVIGGKVIYDKQKDQYYLKGQSKQEFNLVAEGIRKMALLWQLVKQGALKNGDILFWDEPESNINPEHIPIIVETLLELQRNGIQIFISTHSYILAKYFEIRSKDSDDILYLSLNKEKKFVSVESSEKFSELKNNVLISSFDKLLDEVYNVEVRG